MSRIRNNPGPEKSFFLLANQFARDPRVTPRAARVYIYLRSHTDGWETNVRNIGTAVGMGKNAVATALVELVELGYVAREQQRDDQGRVTGMDYVTYAEPCPQNRDTDAAAVAQNEGYGGDQGKQSEPAGGNWNPGNGNPESGNPKSGTYKKNNLQEHQSEEHQKNTHAAAAAQDGDLFAAAGTPATAPQPQQPDLDAEFDQWWQGVPRKKSKGDARKAFRTARKRVPLQVLVDGMAASVVQWQREGRTANLLPYPATWLRSEGWQDQPDEWQQQVPQQQAQQQPAQAMAPWAAYLDDGPTSTQEPRPDYAQGHTIIDDDWS